MAILQTITRLCMATCLFTCFLLADDATGAWRGKAEWKVGDQSRALGVYLILKQMGQSLTGTAGPDKERQTEITSGAVDGRKLHFEVAGGKFVFDLEISGDEIRGGVRLSEGGESVPGKALFTRTVE